MALPPEIGDREQQKFVEDDFGNVSVRGQAANINGISAENTSTALLAANAAFVGSWTDVSSYDSVLYSVITDEPGHMEMQFNSTGTGLPLTIDRFEIEPTVHQTRNLPIKYQYYRTVYTNAGFNQTQFALATMFGSHPSPTGEPVLVSDKDGFPVRVSHRDNIRMIEVHDHETHSTMQDILGELKEQTTLLNLILE